MKERLRKISDYEFDLGKEGRMIVPAKVFISEKLLKDVEETAIQQIVNVATLPGIQKYSIALPDVHSGYGFPIGGVAAFDMNEGIISPGGVGYDINCLSKSSKVLTEFGYNKKIENFEESAENDSLRIFDMEKSKEDNSKIALFMKKYSDKIIKIKTKSGMEIAATEEHPLYTKGGMRKTKEIKIGDEILIYPFDGVEYEKPPRMLLIDERNIDNLKRSKTSKLQIKNKLKSLGLLPLYTDNPKIPYLLKIIGFIFGDGSLSIKKAPQIGFYGKKEDLELIKKDIEKIGFQSSIFSRERCHNIRTQYNNYEFSRTEHTLKSNSSSFAVLLNLLGVPEGNKAEQEYKIPEWIMNSPKWYKRLFLATLFGAELSSPKTMTNHGFNFYWLVFSMNKNDSLHGLNFVNQISNILEEFCIRSVLLKYRVDEVNGKKSTRIRLMIHQDSANLIKLFSKINYEYNIKKRKLANAAILWLRQKEGILKLREDTMIKAREMKRGGFTKSQITNNLTGEYVNKYFLDKAIYYEDYGRTGSRIAYCFITFNEFVEQNCYGEEGFVWDTVEGKEEKA